MRTKVKIILAGGIVALVSFLFVIALGNRGAVDFYQLHLRKVRLHRSNRDLQKKNDELYEKIQRLKIDFELIENIARTELGMVGKDEVVYQFKKPAKKNP
jgi:cell division protein FtsB